MSPMSAVAPMTPSAPARSRRAAEAWRVAAVAVLLAVTAAGLRVRGTFSNGSNPTTLGASGSVLATALYAAEGLALVAFIVLLVSARPQRKPKRDETEPPRPPLPWWAKTLGLLVALAAIITPFAVLFTRHTRKTPVRPLPGAPGSGSLGLTAPQASSSTWPVIAGMVIAIAVVLALTVLSRRRRAPDAPRDRGRRLAGLLDSLAAGRGALIAGGEPREAIIACYVAMERGFAAAGSAPAAADTPAEVLTRASEAGLVRSDSAGTLTGLFRRARYSSEPMTSADSAAAAAALDQMRGDLTQSAAVPS
jgi:Domain of unknown function (DUF4129)